MKTLGLIVAFMLAGASGVLAAPPKVPGSAAEWATFSAAERRAALAHQEQLLTEALASGQAVVHFKGVRDDGTVFRGNLQGGRDLDATLNSLDWNCGLSWINVGSGIWTRGWAYVDTSYPNYYIYAGRGGLPNQFIRANEVLHRFFAYNMGGGADYIRAESNQNFKWWYENINYRVKSWLGAQRYRNGSYQLGPDAYCTVTANP